jgi:hypothetical protein
MNFSAVHDPTMMTGKMSYSVQGFAGGFADVDAARNRWLERRGLRLSAADSVGMTKGQLRAARMKKSGTVL